MVKRNPVLALLAAVMLLSLASCSSSSYIPLGSGMNPDIRKLNSEMSGKNVWINDQMKVEPPLTVRFAVDTFFSRYPGKPEFARSYNELQSITFRHSMEGGKRGAIGGTAVGVVAGYIIQFSSLSDLKEGETPSTFEVMSPYICAIGGAGIGFLVGYIIGVDYTYHVARGASVSTSF